MKLMMDYAAVVKTCGPVPPAIYAAVERYVEHGIEPGGFVRACLENDLRGAVMRADAQNSTYLPQICMMLSKAMPFIAFGSPARVKAWLDGGWKTVTAAAKEAPISMVEREHTL